MWPVRLGNHTSVKQLDVWYIENSSSWQLLQCNFFNKIYFYWALPGHILIKFTTTVYYI